MPSEGEPTGINPTVAAEVAPRAAVVEGAGE
jgi:hypothetical protein